MENCLRMAWQLTLKEISDGCNNEENNEGCNNKNFVMSPMSIINALSILAFGSRGRTLEQLLDFLEAKDMDNLKAKVSLMCLLVHPLRTPTPTPMKVWFCLLLTGFGLINVSLWNPPSRRLPKPLSGQKQMRWTLWMRYEIHLITIFVLLGFTSSYFITSIRENDNDMSVV